jgi:hypothetical protein
VIVVSAPGASVAVANAGGLPSLLSTIVNVIVSGVACGSEVSGRFVVFTT